MTQTWLDILATAGVSVIIALAVGAGFYKYASMDLRDAVRTLKTATDEVLIEAKNLRFLNNLILLALQNAGLADLRTDDQGRIVGLNVSIEVEGGVIRFNTDANLTDGSD